MAENEAKARKKLEEAERKAKGGSGFLGSLFGGAKADEAADLFVQERQEEESGWQQRSNNEICCMEKGCGETFDDIKCYEEHYELYHRHQCSVCGLRFANTHRLELHSDEKHSSFFKAQLQLRPEVALFRCWDSECTFVFRNAEERNEHSLKEHMIEDGEMKLEKRKLARKTWEGRSNDAVHGMVISAKNTKGRIAAPRAIVFGNDEQQEPMFEGRRFLRASFHQRAAFDDDRQSS